MENKKALIVECEIIVEELVCKIYNDTDYDNTITDIIIKAETGVTIYNAPIKSEVIKSKKDIKHLHFPKNIIIGYLNEFRLSHTSMLKLLIITTDNDKFESNWVRFNN